MRIRDAIASRAKRFGVVAVLKAFRRREDAVAGVEFALVLPFLVTLGLGVNEYCRYVLISKRATVAAASIAQMVSSTTDKVDEYELGNFEKSVITMPHLSRDAAAVPLHFWGVARVNISSIRFKPISPGCVELTCAHEAFVLWSYGYARRSCGKLTPVSDNAEPKASTIAQSVVGPGSVVSVELAYLYVPIVGAGILPKTTITKTAYLAPRYVPYVELASTSRDGLPVDRCSGV